MLRIIAPVLILLVASAHAQTYGDPPARVARLAYVRGPVSFSPAGLDDWSLAPLNRPLVAGDRLWTDAGGRDELQAGGATVRMNSNTLVTILTLDDRSLQLQLSQGALNVRVRPGAPGGTVEVDTPNLALSIQQPGHYRVDVDPAGDATVVRVDDGQAQAIGQYQAYVINPGQAFRFTGPDLRNAQALDPRYRDDFDIWAANRDRRADRALATRYVSPALIGYEDLDDYGTWRTVPSYGPVWVPSRVPRGWAPYRDGHWAWIAPWGWTWIDDAPWGFAVTHYGRWAYLDDGWGWVPGPSRALPVYAPALVVFAAQLSVPSWREPAVAWFPLGPREAYRPPYPASPRYVSAINISNTTNIINNVYVNRQVGGAVTAVPQGVFLRARPVRHAAVALPAERIVRAPLLAAPPVTAQRESFASRPGSGHRPAPGLLARPVMTHMQPAIAATRHGPPPRAAAPGATLPMAPAMHIAPEPPPAHGPGAAAQMALHGRQDERLAREARPGPAAPLSQPSHGTPQERLSQAPKSPVHAGGRMPPPQTMPAQIAPLPPTPPQIPAHAPQQAHVPHGGQAPQFIQGGPQHDHAMALEGGRAKRPAAPVEMMRSAPAAPPAPHPQGQQAAAERPAPPAPHAAAPGAGHAPPPLAHAPAAPMPHREQAVPHPAPAAHPAPPAPHAAPVPAPRPAPPAPHPAPAMAPRPAPQAHAAPAPHPAPPARPPEPPHAAAPAPHPAPAAPAAAPRPAPAERPQHGHPGHPKDAHH